MALNPSPDLNNSPNQVSNQTIFEDPTYKELLLSYQKAEWLKCNNLIHSLMDKYPGYPMLLDFKNDLEVQLLLHNIDTQEAKAHKRQVGGAFIRDSVIILVLVGCIGYTIIWFYNSFTKTPTVIPTSIPTVSVQVEGDNQTGVLDTLKGQVVVLLKTGKTEAALEIIKQMQTINPDYPGLKDLEAQAASLAKLDAKYNEAIQNIKSQKYEAALTLLEQLQAAAPNFKDVKSQIEKVKNSISITGLISEAETAFKEERWTDVITIYEEALNIDPSISSDHIKEQQLNSYLKSIISMLTGDQTSMEDIQKAEGYYKKAISLFPQSKEYAQERESLQKLSVNMLVYKYFQAAKQIIEDKNCSEEALGNAVSYLEKVNSLDLNNTTYQAELEKAKNFYDATRKFNAMSWEQAIESLNIIYNFDKNYANGKIRNLLYEAYSARGNRYYSLGLYVDARIDFEAAETVIWENHDNLLQRFQVGINIGNALGKLRNYKDSASYYKYALESIDVYNRASNNVKLVEALKTAQAYFDNSQFLEAYSSYSTALTAYLDYLYTFQKVDLLNGSNLVFIAGAYNSTIQSIQEYNELGKQYVLIKDQTVSIPTLK